MAQATMSVDWRTKFSQEGRTKVVTKIVEVLRTTIVGGLSVEEEQKLIIATKGFEKTIFETSETEQQYAQTIARRITQIQSKAKEKTSEKSHSESPTTPSEITSPELTKHNVNTDEAATRLRRLSLHSQPNTNQRDALIRIATSNSSSTNSTPVGTPNPITPFWMQDAFWNTSSESLLDKENNSGNVLPVIVMIDDVVVDVKNQPSSASSSQSVSLSSSMDSNPSSTPSTPKETRYLPEEDNTEAFFVPKTRTSNPDSPVVQRSGSGSISRGISNKLLQMQQQPTTDRKSAPVERSTLDTNDNNFGSNTFGTSTFGTSTFGTSTFGGSTFNSGRGSILISKIAMELDDFDDIEEASDFVSLSPTEFLLTIRFRSNNIGQQGSLFDMSAWKVNSNGEYQMDVKHDFAVKDNGTVGMVKSMFWYLVKDSIIAGTSGNNMASKKGPQDFTFKVDGDDFLDDNTTLDTVPYIQFCKIINLKPVFFLVEKSKLKLTGKQMGATVGRTLLWNSEELEQIDFRRNMLRIRYAKYLQKMVYDSSKPKYIPEQFRIQVIISQNIKKTVSCQASQTVDEIMAMIFKTNSKVIEKEHNEIINSSTISLFVLKFKGLEEYLTDGTIKFIYYDTVRKLLRKNVQIEMVLVKRKEATNKNWLKMTDYFDQTKLQRLGRNFDNNSSFYANSNNTFFKQLFYDPPKASTPASSTDKRFRMRINKVDGINWEDFGIKKQVNVYVSAGIYYSDKLVEEMRTEEFVFVGGNQPQWNMWIEGPMYRNIPQSGVLHLVVWAKIARKQIPLGWVNMPLTDWRDQVQHGRHSKKLWSDPVNAVTDAGPSLPDPTGHFFENSEDPNAAKISFEIDVALTISFPAVEYGMLDFTALALPSDGERRKLDELFESNPLYVPTEQDRALLWKYRFYCFSNPKSVTKWVWSIPWGDGAKVQEAYQMLQYWPTLEPVAALELLKPRFVDKNVREYAIKNLQKLSDTELSDYLLQLTQALKHEHHHDSPLARFLLNRALLNRNLLGHDLFWYMKAQIGVDEYSQRYQMLLEAYLRCCGTFRHELFKQVNITDQLTSVAQAVCAAHPSKRKATLIEKVTTVKFPQSFQIPINPTLVGRGLKADSCKYMESKTTPLWLVFDNMDLLGDQIYSMLKIGDDLRQDQLTLQMFAIMDKLWLKEGLDLKMVHYKVVATGPQSGWVQIVRDSKTCAAIQGGVSEVFNEKTIATWLKQNNPSPAEYEAAVDNFVRSCAGSCVATYVLGIGDRHNDNIMINKSGQMFHIDFGKFLGNAQMFLIVKRDRAPFVFTPDMAYVMGGTNSDKFKMFVDLCCKAYNVVRGYANLFINLFAMMLRTGIPELKAEEDLNYLREAFSLQQSDEEAAKYFTKLIFDSLNTKSIQFNFAIHLLANMKDN